jgi:ABC-type antimicrobial peptide transport system permease subunit
MLRNYFITAYRNIKKNLSYTLINTFGLGVGIACVLTVFTIIDYEYSFDDWHQKKGNIYRYTTIFHGDHWTNYDGIVAYPTGKVLREEFPEIRNVVEFHGPMDERLSFIDPDGTFQIFRENDVLHTESSFFDLLDFQVLRGNKDDLDLPNKIFLTKSVAEKYFPDVNPIGQIIKYRNENSMEVAGIVEDPPKNTNLPFKVLISIASLRERDERMWTLWHMTWAYSAYVEVADGTDIAALNEKIDKVIDAYADPDDPEEWKKTEVSLQPLGEIHNDEKYGDGYHYVTPSMMIKTFIFLGLLILSAGILNFVNLSTAIAIRRSKEVGVRKTLGSSKGQLITQFMVETFFIVLSAVLIGFAFGQFLLDGFESAVSIVVYELSFGLNAIIFAIGLTILITLLAGFYPSMILSGYQPVDAIKNKITLSKGSGSFNIRRGLIIMQFALTSILIISALIISAQIDFVKNRDMGFDYQNVVIIDTPSESTKDPQGLMDLFQTKSYVQDACLGFAAPFAGNNWNNSYRIQGEENIDGNTANMKFMDENYLEFYDIKIIIGRNIKNQDINDSTYHVLVNQKLIASLGWNTPEEAMGRTLRVNDDYMKIVGVVEDFSLYDATNKVGASLMYYEKDQLKQLALRVNVSELQSLLPDIESTFNAYYPNELFEFSILKNQMDGWYAVEDLLSKVIRLVSFLAVVLSAMGLYGLVSYMANRNAKVIGIRKVFGATTGNILGIFTKEYFRLILVAFLFAGPMVYFLIQYWLEAYVYRITIGMHYFLMGFGLTLLIALLTVGYRSFIAAKANPIKSLRYE